MSVGNQDVFVGELLVCDSFSNTYLSDDRDVESRSNALDRFKSMCIGISNL